VSLLIAEVELRIALARKRLLVLNMLVPLLLVVPVVLGAAPAFHASAVYAVLFMLFGTFGSAIPLVRDAEMGLVGRILQTGIRPGGFLVQRAAAGCTVDAVQLLPALAVATFGSLSLGGFLTTFVIMWASLWIANLLGNIVAGMARSLAETALFAAVTALFMLHFSGVFRTPIPGTFWGIVEAASPFRILHETLLGMSVGASVEGASALIVWAVVLPVLTLVVARPIATSLKAATRQ
jgi:hypothetical protein